MFPMFVISTHIDSVPNEFAVSNSDKEVQCKTASGEFVSNFVSSIKTFFLRNRINVAFVLLSSVLGMLSSSYFLIQVTCHAEKCLRIQYLSNLLFAVVNKAGTKWKEENDVGKHKVVCLTCRTWHLKAFKVFSFPRRRSELLSRSANRSMSINFEKQFHFLTQTWC